jgi:endo-1,4-beta-xylanase
MKITRREGLAMAAGMAAMSAAPAWALQDVPSESLNALAQRTGRRFGSCVGGRSFPDARYRRLLTGECGVLVSENEMKWQWVRRRPQGFDFAPFDPLVAFSQENGLKMRGHTLLWHHMQWFPDWLVRHDFGPNPRPAAEQMLAEHIRTVCGRYGTRIHSYDVINEAVDAGTGALRETVLSRAMGSAEAVLDLAFRTAREAAPHAELVYNDYMSWEPWNETHRAGVLRLLEGFKRRGVPVDTLGVQGHIGSENDDDSTGFGTRQEAEWRRFLDEVVGMGYKLTITELDVHDKGLPAEIGPRDRAAADFCKAYLDLMLSYEAMGDVLVWGMTDRYSWLQERWLRPDRLPKRPCPYDADFRPKPLREAIAASFRGATTRFRAA